MVTIGLGDNLLQEEIDETSKKQGVVLSEITACHIWGPGNGSYIKKLLSGNYKIKLIGYHLAPIEHYDVVKKGTIKELEDRIKELTEKPTAPPEPEQ